MVSFQLSPELFEPANRSTRPLKLVASEGGRMERGNAVARALLPECYLTKISTMIVEVPRIRRFWPMTWILKRSPDAVGGAR